MPLEILLALVVFGIGLVLAVTHALGGSAPRRLDAMSARATFEAEFPGLRPIGVQVDKAEQTAVLWLSDGRIGVVTQLGLHPAVRVVPADQLQRLDAERVRIRFDEVGWPVRDLELAPPLGGDRA